MSDNLPAPAVATMVREINSDINGKYLVCGAEPDWQCDEVMHRQEGSPTRGKAALPVRGYRQPAPIAYDPELSARLICAVMEDVTVARARDNLRALADQLAAAGEQLATVTRRLSEVTTERDALRLETEITVTRARRGRLIDGVARSARVLDPYINKYINTKNRERS
jgi:hypothetical protein